MSQTIQLKSKGDMNDEPAIKIFNDNRDLMHIKNDGKVFWRKNGKMTQAKMDSELALAFAYTVTELAKMSPEGVIREITANYHQQLVTEVEGLKTQNEDIGWKAAHHSGSDAGAGYVIGYKSALDDVLKLLKKDTHE